MGDRLNIIIKQGSGKPSVILYSHWGRTTLEEGLLGRAIEDAVDRIGDPGYFTAIMVGQLGDQVSGIGTSLDDLDAGYVAVVDAMTGQREQDISPDEAEALLEGAS